MACVIQEVWQKSFGRFWTPRRPRRITRKSRPLQCTNAARALGSCLDNQWFPGGKETLLLHQVPVMATPTAAGNPDTTQAISVRGLQNVWTFAVSLERARVLRQGVVAQSLMR